MSYFLTLHSRDMPVNSIKADSLEEASAFFRSWIECYNLGASDLMREAGKIHDPHGNLVARVSYNGKVWPPEMWFPGQQPIDVSQVS